MIVIFNPRGKWHKMDRKLDAAIADALGYEVAMDGLKRSKTRN
jgi:hypothetical protein